MDNIKITGDFFMRTYKIIDNKKILIDVFKDNNKVVNLGKDALRKLIANDGTTNYISQIAFGESDVVPTVVDTTLLNKYIKSLDDFEYVDDTSIKFNWTLETTEANGLSIKEYGLYTAGDILFARKTRSVVDKAADIYLEGSWQINFI